MTLKFLHSATFAALFALTSTCAQAVDFPTRPIRMVIGYSAGGPTDVIARIVAKHMSSDLGQSVVVENKPGASASIATNDVMRSPPDGYKLLVASLNLNVNPLIYPDRYDYDSVKAFAPISNFVNLPMVVVSAYNSPYNTMRDLIADAKEKPNTVTFGSSGFGGSAHLAGEMLSTMANIKMSHIPFKGNAPALQEVMAGRLSFMFYPSIGITAYVAEKQLKVLAVGTKKPWADFPNVPTLESMGLKGFEESAPWVGMLAPAGTPKEIINKLNKSSVAALNDPEVRRQIANLGAVIIADSPEHFKEFLMQDKVRWADVIKKGNVVAQ